MNVASRLQDTQSQQQIPAGRQISNEPCRWVGVTKTKRLSGVVQNIGLSSLFHSAFPGSSHMRDFLLTPVCPIEKITSLFNVAIRNRRGYYERCRCPASDPQFNIHWAIALPNVGWSDSSVGTVLGPGRRAFGLILSSNKTLSIVTPRQRLSGPIYASLWHRSGYKKKENNPMYKKQIDLRVCEVMRPTDRWMCVGLTVDVSSVPAVWSQHCIIWDLLEAMSLHLFVHLICE